MQSTASVQPPLAGCAHLESQHRSQQKVRAVCKYTFFSPLLLPKDCMFSTCICAVPQNQAPTNLLLLGRLGFQPIGAPAHARSQELGQSNSDETPYLQSDNFVTLQTRGGFSFLSTWVDPEVLGELSHRSALGTSRWRPSKCMKFHNTLRLQAIVNKSTSIICHDPYRCDPYTAPLKQKGILPSPLTGSWWWQPLLVYQRIFLVDLQG